VNVLKSHLRITVQTLLSGGASQREIERVTGVDRKTIRRYAKEAKSPGVATGSGGRTDRTAAVVCVAGENACPPEDVGGPPGYFEFLTAIRDPTHQEHANLLRWIGGSFDPTAFDLAEVNARLAEIKA
jgi:hypothetical protein